MRGTGHRGGTFALIIALLFIVTAVSAGSFGCRDEGDPNYWLGKLEEPLWRDEALRKLSDLFSEEMRANNNDRNSEPVKAFITNVGGELIKAYSAPYMDSGGIADPARTKIVALLSQMDTPGALPVYTKAIVEISGTKIDRANTAAGAITRFCRDSVDGARFPPPPHKRDDYWRGRCTKAEPTIPILIKTLTDIDAQRLSRGTNAENTPEENALARSVVAALGNTVLGNPETTHMDGAVQSLAKVLRTPDTAQDFAINMLALQMLGEIGEPNTIPVLIQALFMQGRGVALQEVARPCLMQVHDLDAVAKALVKAGNLQDQALNKMQQDDPNFDVRLIKEQVSITLGELGVKNAEVIDYLTKEFNHEEIDDFDNTKARGPVAFTPENSKGYRRMWGGRALGKLRHEPALETLLERLEHRNGEIRNEDTLPFEVPGYVHGAFFMMMPEKTADLFYTLAQIDNDGLRHSGAYHLSIQGGAEYAAKLKKIGEGLGECNPELRGCVKRDVLEGFVPTLEAAQGCTDVDCWISKLGEKRWRTRERAAYSLAAVAYGDEANQSKARNALIEKLGDDSQDVVNAVVFSIDRLSPQGCDEACLTKINDRAIDLLSKSTLNAQRRALEGLHARLSFRTKAGR